MTNIKITLLSILVLLIIVLLYLFSTDVLQHPRKRALNKYRSIEGCDNMKVQFLEDLEKKDLKFFIQGLYDLSMDEQFISLEKKYSITVYPSGCIGSDEFVCYNLEVAHHFISTSNDSSLYYLVY